MRNNKTKLVFGMEWDDSKETAEPFVCEYDENGNVSFDIGIDSEGCCWFDDEDARALAHFILAMTNKSRNDA